MNHLSIDIETLGRAPTSAPLTIGFCLFDETRIVESGTIWVDLDSSLAAGLTIDEETLRWWMLETSPEARRNLFGPPNSLGSALNALDNLFGRNCGREHGLVWTKGPSFDGAILDNAYFRARQLGLYSCGPQSITPWKYSSHRDVRTIVEASGLVLCHANSHAAQEDAVAQARMVQEAWALLK